MVKKYSFEIETAKEFLNSAKFNLDCSLRTSANRLYFALEKAVIAYFLFMKMKIPKNHQKLWEISAKFLGEDYYKTLRELYDLRMQADYGLVSIFVNLTKENLINYLPRVEFLIKRIKKNF